MPLPPLWTWSTLDEKLISSLAALVRFLNLNLGKLATFLSDLYAYIREQNGINVLNYLQPGQTLDGLTDTVSAIDKARARALLTGLPLIFPSGIYAVATTLNLGFSALTCLALGPVTFKRIGIAATPVLAFDSGSPTGSILNERFLGDFRVQGNAFSTKSLYTRGFHHSQLELREVDGSAVSFDVNWSVCSTFRLIQSSTYGAFTTIPNIGLQVDETDPGYYTADSDFYVIIETVNGFGVHLKTCSGCHFKGTSEGIVGIGVVEEAGCRRNQFEDFWWEGNTVSDLDTEGDDTLLDNPTVASSIAVSANLRAAGQRLKTYGGYVRWVDKVGDDSHFSATAFADHPALGIQGSGTHTCIGCTEVDGSFNTTGLVPGVI